VFDSVALDAFCQTCTIVQFETAATTDAKKQQQEWTQQTDRVIASCLSRSVLRAVFEQHKSQWVRLDAKAKAWVHRTAALSVAIQKLVDYCLAFFGLD